MLIRNGDLVRLGEDGPAGEEQRTALKACRDRQSGLWGLRCGNKITVIPQYREVFDICANRAAVRFKDGRTGVVDKSGDPHGGDRLLPEIEIPEGRTSFCHQQRMGRDCLYRFEDKQNLSGEAGGFFIRRHRVAAGGGDFP